MEQARPPGPPPQDVRKLSRSLAAARNEQIMRAVAMVDSLAERGAADGVIAPLRPRLAELRPARPLRFTRLLFLPLDPVIVPAPDWRPGSATVPRTTLAPLAEAVRAALGPASKTLDAACAGRSMADKGIIAEVGEMLWPAAGAILAANPKLAGWPATGLPPAVAAGIATAAGAVLLAAVPLRRLRAEAEIGVTLQAEPVQAILAQVARSGSEALAMAVAVLLAWLPQAADLLPRSTGGAGHDGTVQMRLATGQATAVLLAKLESADGTEALIRAGSLDESATEVRRIAMLLDALDETGPKERRSRLAAIRERVEQSCRPRFVSGLENGVAAKLRSMQRNPPPQQVAELENTARSLRQLENAARRFGGGAFYDALLHNTSTAVWANQADSKLCLADKVRLVEILEGPDAADALLEQVLPAYQLETADPRLLPPASAGHQSATFSG